LLSKVQQQLEHLQPQLCMQVLWQQLEELQEQGMAHACRQKATCLGAASGACQEGKDADVSSSSSNTR
jgi:hypothetical protein